ncbi:hypothetical protein SESBI_28372 [Sesbania bispinosa]|nr:hypothetical protein SESBI_28372 [Sesbania bispinosa]
MPNLKCSSAFPTPSTVSNPGVIIRRFPLPAPTNNFLTFLMFLPKGFILEALSTAQFRFMPKNNWGVVGANRGDGYGHSMWEQISPRPVNQYPVKFFSGYHPIAGIAGPSIFIALEFQIHQSRVIQNPPKKAYSCCIDRLGTLLFKLRQYFIKVTYTAPRMVLCKLQGLESVP